MYLKLILIFLTSMYYCFEENSDTYSINYDNLDIDSILNNERVLKIYMDCIMERGRCTPHGEELRKHISDAMKTECSKCTEAQKALAGRAMAFLLLYKRHYWEEILAKYDPEGNFKAKYEKELDEDADYSWFYNRT